VLRPVTGVTESQSGNTWNRLTALDFPPINFRYYQKSRKGWTALWFRTILTLRCSDIAAGET